MVLLLDVKAEFGAIATLGFFHFLQVIINIYYE